ncbi:MAG: beta-ketoacyl-[acyl-carrier-protein] synthase family protein [Spirochaetes bacterium]|nr:beta-ketoacyl-[acyl-carrier-protein] synthase family protein [Spirochaetota bacterium]
MDSKQPVILAYDMVSPLGTDLETQWKRAVSGESGIGKLTRFPYNDDFPVQIAGQVPDIDIAPYPFLSPREMAHWTSPIFKNSMLVVHRALEKSGIEITPELSPRVGITFSTAVGGLDAVIAADRLMVKDNRLPNPFTNPNSCINMVGGKVSILTGATGPITATITACATGSTSMIIGSMFLRQGLADAVICGAVDCPLVEPIVAGFATMNGAFKDKKDKREDPGAASRPFSADRRGFVVSEGAACVIIATREFADAHGLKYELAIAGHAMTSDAYHFVAPNPDTVTRCIAESIASAGLTPEDIDAVNAHGTSTKIGDKVEFDSLTKIFGSSIPPVSANKSQIGHAMGASSGIESVFALEGMLKDTVLPTINYNADPELTLDCVPDGARKLEQEFVLKNAFGFGGCNSCIVFQRTRQEYPSVSL